MKRIYLDYSATTPLDPLVLSAMMPYLTNDFGNASSIHQLGRRALLALDDSRLKLAGFLNCNASELIFTGSASESDNLAIAGVVREIKRKQPNFIPHIIVSSIEHSAVIRCCDNLKTEGVEVSCVPVNKDGIVEAAKIESLIKDNTVLVSVMYANNEIGTIQPVGEIGRMLQRIRNTKNSPYPLFHTDAVQAVNYLDCDVQKSGVDLLTLSAHKICGPKGVGALYVRQGVSLLPLTFGGSQEKSLRPGTENIAGIVGLSAAVKLIDRNRDLTTRIKHLRNRLSLFLLANIPGCKLNGSEIKRLPNNINITIPNVSSKQLVLILDQKNISISSGSACHASSTNPSHVLKAIGLSDKEADSSIRISLGNKTTEAEIIYASRIITETVNQIRI